MRISITTKRQERKERERQYRAKVDALEYNRRFWATSGDLKSLAHRVKELEDAAAPKHTELEERLLSTMRNAAQLLMEETGRGHHAHLILTSMLHDVEKE